MGSTGIRVREATPDDRQSIVEFQQAMARESEGRSLDADLLEKGVTAVFHSEDKGFYVVAEGGSGVVGSLLITFEWSDWRNATFWWIQSVYVDPQWRRRGVYRAMHDYVYSAARARDEICGIRLYVEEKNLAAQQTYERLGMAKSHYHMYEIDFVL